MLESGPNVRFFWVAMNSDYSSVSLARSWREGRISPDDLFEAKGKRLTTYPVESIEDITPEPIEEELPQEELEPETPEPQEENTDGQLNLFDND